MRPPSFEADPCIRAVPGGWAHSEGQRYNRPGARELFEVYAGRNRSGAGTGVTHPLSALTGLKILATSITIGSGGSGGVFFDAD